MEGGRKYIRDFSTEVSLEKMGNLIQKIVAVDIEDNISFQTVAGFYLD
jgi:hypothetical protein